ncbi:aldolase/citrate lyase family protein [Chthonobacter albigriseus]|uniref:aldolase/citrate lyase family protein n=1 Tax=Chthonobacter albigriseus TaxID=1683161 RepID=UPI0015EECECE
MSISIAERFEAGESLLMGWISLPEPLVAEAVVRAGFDTLLIDMQHGLVDLASAFRIVSAVRAAGGRSLVRIPVGEFATASRLLDAGADGVVAPMIETVEDARAFAAFMKYPPAGSRSWGPTRAVQLDRVTPQQYRAEANGRTMAFAMIETRRALEEIDAILAEPGIDGVFVGPADLSIALSGGTLDTEAPAAQAAIAKVAGRAKAAGKPAGIYAGTPAEARRRLDGGYRFATLMSDLGYITAGALAAIDAAKP